MTKRTIEAMIRKKYGKGAYLRENKRASSPEQREQGKVRLAEIRDRVVKIKAELAQLQRHDKRLLIAASFVCDVNGDHPSIDQLREAVAESQRFADLSEERRELEAERSKLSGESCRFRWEACNVNTVGGVQFCSIHESADTLEELAEKFQPKAAMAV